MLIFPWWVPAVLLILFIVGVVVCLGYAMSDVSIPVWKTRTAFWGTVGLLIFFLVTFGLDLVAIIVMRSIG